MYKPDDFLFVCLFQGSVLAFLNPMPFCQRAPTVFLQRLQLATTAPYDTTQESDQSYTFYVHTVPVSDVARLKLAHGAIPQKPVAHLLQHDIVMWHVKRKSCSSTPWWVFPQGIFATVHLAVAELHVDPNMCVAAPLHSGFLSAEFCQIPFCNSPLRCCNVVCVCACSNPHFFFFLSFFLQKFARTFSCDSG